MLSEVLIWRFLPFGPPRGEGPIDTRGLSEETSSGEVVKKSKVLL